MVKCLPTMQETRVGKIPWGRKCQLIPVLLPRKSHERRSLVQAIVHGVTKSQTRLSDFTFIFSDMRPSISDFILGLLVCLFLEGNSFFEFFSLLHSMACRTLVLQSGIKSRLLGVKALNLNQWMARDFLAVLFLTEANLNHMPSSCNRLVSAFTQR